jgi:hypothetical protein
MPSAFARRLSSALQRPEHVLASDLRPLKEEPQITHARPPAATCGGVASGEGEVAAAAWERARDGSTAARNGSSVMPVLGRRRGSINRGWMFSTTSSHPRVARPRCCRSLRPGGVGRLRPPRRGSRRCVRGKLGAPAPADADAVWRRVITDPPPANVPVAIHACAAVLGVPLQPFAVPRLTPTPAFLWLAPAPSPQSQRLSPRNASSRGPTRSPASHPLPVIASSRFSLLPSSAPSRRSFSARASPPRAAAFGERLASDDADPSDRAAVEAS